MKKAEIDRTTAEPWRTLPLPSARAVPLTLNLRGRGPTKEELTTFFERFGVHPVHQPALVDRLLEVEPRARAKFLRRLADLRGPEADRVVTRMIADTYYGDGLFAAAPGDFVAEVLSRRGQSVKPEWRTLGARPLEEVPGYQERMTEVLAPMLDEHAELTRRLAPPRRTPSMAEAHAAIARVLDRLPIELKGELLATLATWPNYQWRGLARDAMGLALDGFAQPKDPGPEALAAFEDRWRWELGRDRDLLAFLDLAGFEPIGTQYRAADAAAPRLVAAASRMIFKRSKDPREWLESHRSAALNVLVETPLQDPQIDKVLLRYLRAGGLDAWRAGLALMARGHALANLRPVLVAAADATRSRKVLAALREQDRLGRLLQIPAPVRAALRAAMARHPQGAPRLIEFWRAGGQPVEDFLGRLGWDSPPAQPEPRRQAE